MAWYVYLATKTKIMVVILHEDTVHQIAYKIFEGFELHQSCTITGYLLDEERKLVLYKGEEVLRVLRKMDEDVNTNRPSGDKRIRRRRIVLPDSIGGYVAQKIFRYKKTVLDDEHRWSIWRVQ